MNKPADPGRESMQIRLIVYHSGGIVMARGTRNKGYSLCFSTRGRTTDRDKVDFTNRDTLALPLLLLCW